MDKMNSDMPAAALAANKEWTDKFEAAPAAHKEWADKLDDLRKVELSEELNDVITVGPISINDRPTVVYYNMKTENLKFSRPTYNVYYQKLEPVDTNSTK